MGLLKDCNIVVDGGKASDLFESLLGEINFFEVEYSNPKEYVQTYWTAYQKSGKQSNNTNGKIFEYILCTLLIRENLVPYFVSAKIAFVPNVIYDITLFTNETGPISLSAKTSLRERYKQADLEAIALKYVHRKAKSYLLTNNRAEAELRKKNIKSGDIIGLDDVIYSLSDEMNELITYLKRFTYCHPGSVEVITASQMVTGLI